MKYEITFIYICAQIKISYEMSACLIVRLTTIERVRVCQELNTNDLFEKMKKRNDGRVNLFCLLL
jgi:hypothetical protein